MDLRLSDQIEDWILRFKIEKRWEWKFTWTLIILHSTFWENMNSSQKIPVGSFSNNFCAVKCNKILNNPKKSLNWCNTSTRFSWYDLILSDFIKEISLISFHLKYAERLFRLLIVSNNLYYLNINSFICRHFGIHFCS